MNTALIFIGPSGSGKSTLIHRLAENFGLQTIDVLDYVTKYLDPQYAIEERLLKIAYRELMSDLSSKSFDVVEIATDWPEEIIPELVKILCKIGRRNITLIFCSASSRTCLQRNAKRKRSIPTSAIKRQVNINSKFLRSIARSVGINFIVVHADDNPDNVYQELIEKLTLKRR